MSNNESDSWIPFSNCGRRIRMDGDKIEKNCYFSQTQFPSTFVLLLYQASKTMWHFQHISHIVCNISHIVCNITSAAFQHSPNLIFSPRFGHISGFSALRYIFKRWYSDRVLVLAAENLTCFLVPERAPHTFYPYQYHPPSGPYWTPDLREAFSHDHSPRTRCGGRRGGGCGMWMRSCRWRFRGWR